MKTLRWRITLAVLWLSLLFNIERFDFDTGTTVNLASSFYILAAFTTAVFLLLPMKRLAIADYLGLTIETVSRSFTALARLGVIEMLGVGAVRIVSMPALRDIAEARQPPSVSAPTNGLRQR